MLIEKYYSNTKLVVDTSGVACAVGLHNKTLPPSPAAKKVTCKICYDVFPYGETVGLACGHRFCRECWQPYLKYKVMEGSTCIFTTCPMKDCSEIVPEIKFQQILSKEINAKYQKFLVESYVDINRMIKWCPGQNCGKAVQGTGAATDVTCDCGCKFCFKCGDESHFPITCKEKINGLIAVVRRVEMQNGFWKTQRNVKVHDKIERTKAATRCHASNVVIRFAGYAKDHGAITAVGTTMDVTNTKRIAMERKTRYLGSKAVRRKVKTIAFYIISNDIQRMSKQ